MLRTLTALIVGTCLALGQAAGAYQRDGKMTTTAKGEFDVKIVPQPSDDKSEGSPMGRMTIDKVWRGDFEGVSKGEMLTAGPGSPAVKDSGVYVAVERISGTLNGRKGTFAVHHTGIMDRGQQSLTITVVPDSGTGELAGIRGTIKIIIDGKKHFYEIDYQLGGR